MFESVAQNVALAGGQFFTVGNLLLLCGGVLFGLFFGALPGFSTSMALVLFLPFTFGVDPIVALSLLMGILVGGISGGLVTTVIIGIPGGSSSIPTLWDGFTLTRKGESAFALGLGIWASFFGGIISWVVLVTLAPVIARVGLEFGPWDFFNLMFFSLTIAASLASGDVIKGLLSAGFGVLLAQVGNDPISGVDRISFDLPFLEQGFDTLVVLVGIFAFAQLLSDMEDRQRAKKAMAGDTKITFENVQHIRALKEIARHWATVIRSSLLGVFIGVVPAVGSNVSSLLAYDQEKKLAKKPESFGKGAPAGVIAPEACNNADAGGSLTVLMSLGVPGDIVSVVLLAALTLHNVAPSPTFISDHPDIAYTIYLAYLLANIAMVVLQSATLRVFMLIRWVPFYMLNGAILFLSALGVFAWTGIVDDLWVVLLLGVIGYGMRLLSFPLAPFILGLVLSAPTEVNLIRALSSSSDLTLFFTRPWALFFLILTAYSLLYPAVARYRATGPRVAGLYYPSMGIMLAVPLFMMDDWGRTLFAALLAALGAYGAWRVLRRASTSSGLSSPEQRA